MANIRILAYCLLASLSTPAAFMILIKSGRRSNRPHMLHVLLDHKIQHRLLASIFAAGAHIIGNIGALQPARKNRVQGISER